MRFLSGLQHNGPNLHFEAALREILEVWQISLCMHALLILKKHLTEFPGINFGRFCRNMALMVSQLLRAIKSFYCRPEISVRVSSIMLALNSGKAAFCHLSFSLLTSGVTKLFLGGPDYCKINGSGPGANCNQTNKSRYLEFPLI